MVKVPLDMILIDKAKLDDHDKDAFVYTGPICIAGYLGFAITNKYKIVDDMIEVSILENVPVRFLTCEFQSVTMFIKSPVKHRPLLNLKPISIQDSEYVFFGSNVGQGNHSVRCICRLFVEGDVAR